MLALYLIAAHLVGDFVLQTRWQAAGKLGDSVEAFTLRGHHVTAYCACFVPIAVVYSPDPWHAGAFVACLWLLHFATDRQRFYTTLGDVVQWRIDSHRAPLVVKREWLEYATGQAEHAGMRAIDVDDDACRWPTPSPWTALPLMIDQTLHLVQLAILGGLLL